MLYLSAWSCVVRTLLYQTTSGHRGQRWGRLAWAPLPAILHFDPPVRQLLNTEIKTKNEDYHSKQLLSPFDRARHSGGIRRNYRDSFIGGRLCDSYKRHKQDHGERSMDTDHGFEDDMPYPPLSPEQPLETREDRDLLHAAIVQLPPVQARRVHAHYILSASKKFPGSRAWGSAGFAKFKIV